MLNRILRTLLAILAACAVLYALLLIPDPEGDIPPVLLQPGRRAFLWDRDSVWAALEENFIQARMDGCTSVTPAINAAMEQLNARIVRLNRERFGPEAPIFREVEQLLFELGPWIGACPEDLPAYMDVVSRMRDVVKRQSESWNMADRSVRETMYRLFYGGRAAVEEVILQMPPGSQPGATTPGTDEPSAAPSAEFLGVKIRSGDILVSRGGAPTSALIARGNDFPGNFSHIALVYVDPVGHGVRLIESHIERGVTIATIDDYIRDTKLRVMVLRLRSDLPALVADPMLPHRAAEGALRRAQARHIPYDFTMNYQDTTKLFCSAVASDAYRRVGVHLWMGLSHISSTGLRAWLAGFGVRYFETQEPSDLEYDPQLRVVGEWRDTETLRKDHYDNAVTEAMLDEARRGARLQHDWYLLPPARMAKAYSVVLNWFGKVGPVPEGMSATAALRNRWYSSLHDSIRARVEEQAAAFRTRRDYPPPYWQIVRIASEALRESGEMRVD